MLVQCCWKEQKINRKNTIVIVSALLCLAVLFVFKYIDFALETVTMIVGKIFIPVKHIIIN